MLHGDTCLSKYSPLKYIESFIAEYSPECENKWVVLDQGGELYNNPAIIYQPVQMLLIKMDTYEGLITLFLIASKLFLLKMD